MRLFLILLSWPVVGVLGTLWSVRVNQLRPLRMSQWLLGIALGWFWVIAMVATLIIDL